MEYEVRSNGRRSFRRDQTAYVMLRTSCFVLGILYRPTLAAAVRNCGGVSWTKYYPVLQT